MPQTATQLANLNRNGRKPGARNKPSAVAERVRRSAAAKTALCIRTIAAIVADPEANDADRIRAASILLDRAVGRPRTAEEAGNVAREEAFAVTRRVLGIEGDE